MKVEKPEDNLSGPFKIHSQWIIPFVDEFYPRQIPDIYYPRDRRIDPFKPNPFNRIEDYLDKKIPTRPLYNIKSDGKYETYEINVAGYKKEEIEIALKESVLQVKAEFENTTGHETLEVSFRLKSNQHIDKIDLVNGILYIKTEFEEHDPGKDYKIGYSR